jgi:hypothetical protein
MAADVGVEANVNPPVGRDWLADDACGLAAYALVARKATKLPNTRERSATVIIASRLALFKDRM